MVNQLEEPITHKYNMDIFNEIAYYDLRQMAEICRERGIKIIICSYPGMFDVDSYDRGLYYAQKRVSLLLNCPFVDNYLILSNIANRAEYFSSDKWHPNDKGYRLVAENIYNCILENKLIK